VGTVTDKNFREIFVVFREGSGVKSSVSKIVPALFNLLLTKTFSNLIKHFLFFIYLFLTKFFICIPHKSGITALFPSNKKSTVQDIMRYLGD
jgi:hypothetical protein